ncbi:MAG: ABC transporter permease subunit [Acidimicrobiia bacterium]|nr:ABC transporter permease subunit [Acidimicrobiia bacterium]
MDTTTVTRPRRPPDWSAVNWRRGLPFVGIAIVLAVWTLGHRFTAYLPPPTTVAGDAMELIGQPDTYGHIIASVRRLVIGLAGGFLAAFLVSMAMRVNEWWRRFFQPYVFVSLTIPSLAVSLFALMIFGLSEIGVYVSVGVIVFPFIVVSLNEGFADLDAQLSEMARAYRFSPWQRIRHVALPEMTPFLFSALRNSYALAWKIVVITEVFSQQIGIGSEYKRSYDYFQLSQLVVWVVFFLIVVFAVEFGVFRPWERRVFRWRRAKANE